MHSKKNSYNTLLLLSLVIWADFWFECKNKHFAPTNKFYQQTITTTRNLFELNTNHRSFEFTTVNWSEPIFVLVVIKRKFDTTSQKPKSIITNKGIFKNEIYQQTKVTKYMYITLPSVNAVKTHSKLFAIHK